MAIEKEVKLDLSLDGNQQDIDQIKNILDQGNLTVQTLPTAPLHMGAEAVALVISVIGTAASVTTLFNELWRRRNRFEIQVKSEDNEIISLNKKSPWTLKDIRKFLKLEED